MIKTLSVKNFRVFDEITVDFNPGVNVIIGKNGVGKTSLLEALYFIAFTKSFKASQDVDMLKRGKDFFQINTTWSGSPYQEATGNFLKQKGKRFIIDEEAIGSISDVIGAFPFVFQSPEDYRVTAGPSLERRLYFDRFISQISQEYLQDLILYRKVLKNRNAHLKELSDKKKYIYTTQMEAYDKQLVPTMYEIVQTRKKYINLFNGYLANLYHSTFDGTATGGIIYQPSIDGTSQKVFGEYHTQKTRDQIDKEIILKRTLLGPNYDKYIFTRNSNPLIHYASQGEHKIWMTMLKLAEGAIIKRVHGEEPIFLLDDLFPKLDLGNSRRIVEHIMNFKQVLITTTDMSDLRRHGMDVDHPTLHIIEIPPQKNSDKTI